MKAFSQNSVTIPESSRASLCGRVVNVDTIWFFEGSVQADISILETERSKPITGGYRPGDLITVSSEPGCTYYVNSITKTGLGSTKGKVILSTDPLGEPIQQCEEEITMYEGTLYKIDTLDWNISSVRRSDSGNIEAFITSTYMTEKISDFPFPALGRLWLGGCLYEAVELTPSSNDFLFDPNPRNKYTPGSIKFKKVH
jgi:hypothetical protein